MRTSSKGIDLIKEYEGFEDKPYLPTPDDVPTIGYGTTVYPTGKKVKLTDAAITRAQGEEYLKSDLVSREKVVNTYITVPLNQNQFDALVSLIYNIGSEAFKGSTLRRKLNAKDYKGAANEFNKWVYQKGKKLNGLVTRRAKERLLFLS